MTIISNKKILLSVFCFFALIGAGFLCFSLLTKLPAVKAGESDNVVGWAWSENIGWLSFNCTNTNCLSSDYGVNIETDGSFSGYAWSENIGWVSFAPAGPYPSDPQYSARVNIEDGSISGWARALSNGGGWDGWILLDGVSINTETGVFSGFAWGSDVVGWLSFSGTNYQTETTLSFNSAPSAGDLSVSQGDYCLSPLQPILNWIFSDPDGDLQDSYQVQVYDVEGNLILDSCDPFPGTCSAGHSSSSYAPAPSFMSFAYNSTYYWRVKVADEYGAWSDWSGDVSFATPNHAFPEPNFSWVPQRISKDEFVQFCAVREEEGVCEQDNSICYQAGGDIPIPSCHSKSFVWTFPLGTELAEGSTLNSENPMVKFTSNGALDVSLSITDDVGACSVDSTINITKPLPIWKEIAP